MKCSAGVLVAVVALVAGSELRWSLSFSDEKQHLDGVGNFGKVTPWLYRGAQPTAVGLSSLAALGVNTVVKFSQGEEGAPGERAAVEALGMHFMDLPWSSVRPPPTNRVAAFLTLLRDHPDQVVFVHCKAGSDRTGVMIAVARIVRDHWTTVRAIEEMKAFHYRFIFLPHLQRYIEALPRQLDRDPALEGF